MPRDDLKDYATSDHDFYELLGVNFETSENDIHRAYRKAALKYHPDKNAGKPEVVEKFHLVTIAHDVLSDPTVKALYDNARRARKDKEERDQAFEGKRKQMKEDLERRETNFVQRRQEEDDFERELRRLAQDGQRRRQELQEKRKRDFLEEEDRLDRERNKKVVPDRLDESVVQETPQVPEINRTVKVSWARDSSRQSIDQDRLEKLFEPFGPIDSILLLKDKRMRIGETKTKTMVATGAIVFRSVASAHAAVEDFRNKIHPNLSVLQSVFWADNKQSEFGQQPPAENDQRHIDAKELPKAPSFAFGGTVTQNRSLKELENLTMGRIQAWAKKRLSEYPIHEGHAENESEAQSFATLSDSVAQSAVLEEATMARLKDAEKRRLEEQIRKQDAEAA